MNNRAQVERPPYPWRYLNRTGPQTQKLRGAARKGYGFSFAVPPPDLIARVAEKNPRAGHGTGRLNGHTKNTRDIRLAGRFSVRHASPIQNDPLDCAAGAFNFS